ncbi:MAG TPA: CD225/dispanin family protein, partial [Longimicrobiaceae bacterium]
QQGGGYGGGGGGYGSPPGGGYGGQPPQQIPNYQVQAILVTLCCCLPLGVVSIVYATQVNSKRDSGDIQGAMAASANAKKWVMIALAAGVVGWLIWGAVYGFAMLAAIAGAGNGG